jgi:hypothetical protein
MKISLLAGASCAALIACSSASTDQVGGASTGGVGGAVATGGAAGSTGGVGARSSGGSTVGGSGGVSAGGSGGTDAISSGGAGGVGVDCCASGCDEPCTPRTSRTCKSGTPPGSQAQDCRCDGSGWGAVRSITTAGGACSVLDAGQEHADAAGSGGTPSDAAPGDAGSYCVYEAPGAGGMPSTHCFPFPSGCSSCACLTLPYSFCTCSSDASGVLVRCLGV